MSQKYLGIVHIPISYKSFAFLCLQHSLKPPFPQKKKTQNTTPKLSRGAGEYAQQLHVAFAFPQHIVRMSSGMSIRAQV